MRAAAFNVASSIPGRCHWVVVASSHSPLQSPEHDWQHVPSFVPSLQEEIIELDDGIGGPSHVLHCDEGKATARINRQPAMIKNSASSRMVFSFLRESLEFGHFLQGSLFRMSE